MDNIDMRILSRLVNNCRESDRQIGREIGMSGNAVKSRIRKLEKAGAIGGYTIKIEPPALGYGIFYVVLSGEGVNQKIERIKLVGEPFFIVPCVGGVTVCGIVVGGKMEKKIELAKSIIKDVRVLTIFEAAGAAGAGLTRTDLEVIEKLLPDPRKKIEEVSGETGLSTKTVARTLDKMFGSEDIQFTAMYDPLKLSNYIPYAVLVRISGDTRRIKRGFDRRFGGAYMQAPLLTKNQIVLFMYGGNIFELDEITQGIGGVPGVESTDIFIPKRISFPHAWIKNAIREAKGSPTLHLAHQTS